MSPTTLFKHTWIPVNPNDWSSDNVNVFVICPLKLSFKLITSDNNSKYPTLAFSCGCPLVLIDI